MVTRNYLLCREPPEAHCDDYIPGVLTGSPRILLVRWCSSTSTTMSSSGHIRQSCRSLFRLRLLDFDFFARLADPHFDWCLLDFTFFARLLPSLQDYFCALITDQAADPSAWHSHVITPMLRILASILRALLHTLTQSTTRDLYVYLHFRYLSNSSYSVYPSLELTLIYTETIA